MVLRYHWLDLIEKSWRQKSIVWLSGVRRVGKTVLCRSLPDIEYFDCELPRVRRRLADPEDFLDNLGSKRIVLDEVHRLPNPSELLKIAADHYPRIKIIATGSSTLGASRHFRDTLTGRKIQIWLTPMILADLTDFKHLDLRHRLKQGGLPPFFLDRQIEDRFFQEWLDSYWAKDIQTLFYLEKYSSFQRFAELVFSQSGGVFEANNFAAPCEVSRATIANYLRVMALTHVAQVIRPFSSRRRSEIVSAPKVYAFDTGFVRYYKGWDDLREDDLGLLWEHLVLNEIQGIRQTTDLNYWRDKNGHEIDFVMAGRGRPPITIECKWRQAKFNPKNLISFRNRYPDGLNLIVASDVKESYRKNIAPEIKVTYLNLSQFSQWLRSKAAGS